MIPFKRYLEYSNSQSESTVADAGGLGVEAGEGGWGVKCLMETVSV